ATPSTRRPVIRRTDKSMRLGSRTVDTSRISYPCSTAMFSNACTISGKNGLVISETTSPRVWLRPDTSARACIFGRYPDSSITFHTRFATRGSTVGKRLIVRETVAVDTLARLAISRMIIEYYDFANSARYGPLVAALSGVRRNNLVIDRVPFVGNP